jgi:hypothetical protein
MRSASFLAMTKQEMGTRAIRVVYPDRCFAVQRHPSGAK